MKTPLRLALTLAFTAFLLITAHAQSSQAPSLSPQWPALSPQWEDLTAPDFVSAIHQSQGTCVLPFGIIEKHGPHLPLGTDLLDVRFAVLNAVKQEYAVVFPPYYFGQIFEARQQPGTVAYSLSTQLTLLQETVSEMARNGCKKVVIVNGHGGNNSLLPLFAQAQMASPRDYVVYVFGLPHLDVPGRPARKTPPSKIPSDMHAGESGADQNRLSALPSSVDLGIWWYAKFPNHYAGQGEAATKELGEFDQKEWSRQIAEALKAIKADSESLKLQNQFFNDAQHPLDTKQ
jgi:creatinine amidohydrolase